LELIQKTAKQRERSIITIEFFDHDITFKCPFHRFIAFWAVVISGPDPPQETQTTWKRM